jgi:hypothetical protein
VQSATGLTPSGQTDINRFTAQTVFEFAIFQVNSPGFQFSGEGLLDGIDPGTGLTPFIRRETAQLLHLFGKNAFFAQIMNSDLLKPGQGIGFCKSGSGLLQNSLEGMGHGNGSGG